MANSDRAQDPPRTIEQIMRSIEMEDGPYFSEKDLTLPSIDILKWMLARRELPNYGTIAISGRKPYSNKDFVAFIESIGFEVQYMGATTDTLILGRAGLSFDSITSFLEARRKQGLKVYSQEMFVIELLSGRDLYADPDFRKGLGRYHRGLEVVADWGFDWPSTDIVPSHSNQGMDTDEWPDVGLLSSVGYKTGKSGLPRTKRRKILAEVFEGQLPNVKSEDYMEEWGSPGSSKRLQKLANCLASFARNALYKDDNSLDTAIQHWEQDLDWLKVSYYDNTFGFEWPGI